MGLVAISLMIRLPDVRGKLQSSFTVTCSRFRLKIIVFDTSAFSEFPDYSCTTRAVQPALGHDSHTLSTCRQNSIFEVHHVICLDG